MSQRVGIALTPRSLPLKALLLSAGALVVPVVGTVRAPGWLGQDAGVLVWMSALVPAFLLTFYKGWRGASIALASGMAVLSATQVLLLLSGSMEPDWSLLLGVVVVFVAVSLGLGYFAELLNHERSMAQAESLTDTLTKLPNRRYAEVFLEAAFASAERGTPFSVVLFDLDHFKAYNDTHGHAAGDRILSVFGRILSQSTRRMDLSARYGGEEFVSILLGSDLSVARGFAERVRVSLGQVVFPWGPVTVSAGVAVYEPGMGTPDLMVAAADRALYRAKAEGRDRVALAELLGAGGYTPAGAAVEEGPDRQRRVDPASAFSGEPEVSEGPTRHPGHREVMGGTILVVDDDENVVRSVSKSLKSLGYSPMSTTDPEAALAILERNEDRVDLLLIDVIMPKMNGLTLVEEISRIRSGIPVLYMSGHIHGEVTWPGVPGAVTGFIEKPTTGEDLRRKIAEVLSGVGTETASG